MLTVAPDAEVTITEKTVSVKKEKVTIIGEQETRTVESSPTFSSTLVPVTEVNQGDNVRWVCSKVYLLSSDWLCLTCRALIAKISHTGI